MGSARPILTSYFVALMRANSRSRFDVDSVNGDGVSFCQSSKVKNGVTGWLNCNFHVKSIHRTNLPLVTTSMMLLARVALKGKDLERCQFLTLEYVSCTHLRHAIAAEGVE